MFNSCIPLWCTNHLQQSSCHCYTCAFPALTRQNVHSLKSKVSSAFFVLLCCSIFMFLMVFPPHLHIWRGRRYTVECLSIMQSNIGTNYCRCKCHCISVTAESEHCFQKCVSTKEKSLSGSLKRSILLNTSHLTSVNVGLFRHTGGWLLVLTLRHDSGCVHMCLSNNTTHWQHLVSSKCHLNAKWALVEPDFFFFF